MGVYGEVPILLHIGGNLKITNIEYIGRELLKSPINGVLGEGS